MRTNLKHVLLGMAAGALMVLGIGWTMQGGEGQLTANSLNLVSHMPAQRYPCGDSLALAFTNPDSIPVVGGDGLWFGFQWGAANTLNIQGNGQGPDPSVTPARCGDRIVIDDRAIFFGENTHVKSMGVPRDEVVLDQTRYYSALDASNWPRGLIGIDEWSRVNVGPGNSNELILGGTSYLPETGVIRINAAHTGLGFFSTPPITRQQITGTTTEEQLASLIAVLRAYGLIQ